MFHLSSRVGAPRRRDCGVRSSCGLELDLAERSNVIRHAWQQYSSVLQSGNAETILSANGKAASGVAQGFHGRITLTALFVAAAYFSLAVPCG